MEEPYKLPDGWQWKKLSDVAKWTSGGTPSRKNLKYYENGSIPWIKTGELNDNIITSSEEKITEEAIKNSSAKLLPIHTVVVAMYGATIGKTGILGFEASTNQACACAICNKDLYYKYLFFYLRSIKDFLIKQGKGGAQPNISQAIIKKQIIPLPSFEKQIEIVDFIDREFARLDEAKDKITSALDGAAARKQAILHKAFSGELTAKWREENNVTEPWRNLTLNDVAKWGSGGTPARKNLDYYRNGTINWIKTGELNNGIITDSEEKITEEALKNSSAKLFPKNSVIVAMYGATIGKTGILGIEAATNQACACAICNERINYRFLFYFLQNIKKSLIEEGKGGAQPNISQTIIKRRNIDVPSLTEQQKIVTILDAYKTKNQALTEKLEATLTQIDTLKKAILSKAFRGELIRE